MDVYANGINALFGKTGHFLVILAFVAAFISALAYAQGARSEKNTSWRSLGRLSFMVHAVSVFGVILLLLYMIRTHMFEFEYVWRSSNRALPMRFLLSSFWEGQEGSTLLWMFWHCVIGIILIFTARKWESPVMVTVAAAQVMLGSMLLGIYVLGYKVGASPFTLLRDAMDLPIFKMNPDFIPKDGSGLNPLLQNYWMTIHPPTLFLGFALTTVPFAYAMASLMQRSYKDWVKPVLPWTLVAVAVLGTGILMGGAWAYEALSFGGFWAWDPVENASLVPWLVMVAGLHTLMAYKHTGYSLSATYMLFLSSFLLVLYSSFLTKSGILGDSSVHSFTDMGMSGQLVLTILVFLVPALILFFWRRKDLPSKKAEERLSSREFWLFIGSMVFVLSAVHIAVVTSFPVINKVIGTKLAPPSDIERMFNEVQIWIGILIGMLLGAGQYFSYRHTSMKGYVRNIAIPLSVAVALATFLIVQYEFYRADHLLLTLAGSFGIAANVYFIVLRLKKKTRLWGGSLSHTGFALMMLGILISQGRQEVVSYNQFGVDYGSSFSDQDKAENILLYKDEPSTMARYRLTYLGDSVSEHSVYYKVRYEPLEGTGKPFVLKPYLQMDPQMGNVANPSTRRSVSSDLYTHITAAPVNEEGRIPDSIQTEAFIVKVGDTLQLSRSIAIIDAIQPFVEVDGVETGPDDVAVGLQLRYITLDSTYQLQPVYLIQDQVARAIPLRVEERSMQFAFTKILPESNEVELTVTQQFPRYIIMKAIIFPWINLLWLGALIMITGIVVSVVNRRREAVQATR